MDNNTWDRFYVAFFISNTIKTKHPENRRSDTAFFYARSLVPRGKAPLQAEAAYETSTIKKRGCSANEHPRLNVAHWALAQANSLRRLLWARRAL